MPWTRGEPLTEPHRARLLSAGVTRDVLDGLALAQVTCEAGWWPTWWEDNGNALYLREGVNLPPRLIETMTTYPFSGALLVVGTGLDHLGSWLLGGDDATVFVGPDTALMAGEIYCGGRSTIVLAGKVVGTNRPVVDARNGGSVVAEWDQLWAANTYVATDDMHRLEDLATGERLNAYGAHIRLGRHVWLGRDAVVTGNVEIGEGCVVGARSLVRGQKIGANTAVAGTPARVIREGITWQGEDRP